MLLHDNEQILSKKDRQEMSNGSRLRTREEIKEAVRLGDMAMSAMSVNKKGELSNSPEMLNEIKKLNKTLDSLPSRMPIIEKGMDDNPLYFKEVIKKDDLKKKLRRRANGTFNK